MQTWAKHLTVPAIFLQDFLRLSQLQAELLLAQALFVFSSMLSYLALCTQRHIAVSRRKGSSLVLGSTASVGLPVAVSGLPMRWDERGSGAEAAEAWHAWHCRAPGLFSGVDPTSLLTLGRSKLSTCSDPEINGAWQLTVVVTESQVQ